MAEKSMQLEPATGRKVLETDRTDLWWLSSGITFVYLMAFVVYATWRAFENDYYRFENYLSPFYSPTIVVGWKIFGFHISPALWILPFPLIFRFSCYYYRKAYYRAFFLDPPACAVGEPRPRENYMGEAGFPLVLQNIHRYAWYTIVIFMAILWWDALAAFVWKRSFHIGIGSLVFLVNIVLLSAYTFGCHAWRHLVGGCLNCYSCSISNRVRHSFWEKVTYLNERHGVWAWLSLSSVALTDFYVRCLCVGLFSEKRFF